MRKWLTISTFSFFSFFWKLYLSLSSISKSTNKQSVLCISARASGVIPPPKEHFAQVIDPRINRMKDHKLIDIIGIAICAVICGAENWVDIELYGKAK
jgi:hypothetical protein